MRVWNQKGVAHLLPIIVLGLLVVGVFASLNLAVKNKTNLRTFAQVPSCQTGIQPGDGNILGAIPGQPLQIWCYTLTPGAKDTHTEGQNSWFDDFNHGVSFGQFGSTDFTHDSTQNNYRIFNTSSNVVKTQHWLHANHWMMDIDPTGERGDSGGGAMRPNRSFVFENGKLIIETDVAAGIREYGAQADNWPEIVVTNAPTIANKDANRILDNLYTYGSFGGYWSFGCRLRESENGAGGITCALYNPVKGKSFANNGLSGTEGGRVWEMSWFQHVGSSNYSAEYDNNIEWYMRRCGTVDPDTNCRDRIRLELTKTSVKMFVNGARYFEQSGLKVPFPDEMVNNPVYVYLSGWESGQSVTSRYHWDNFAINPTWAPNAAPGFCLPWPACSGQATPAPTTTPTVAPSQSASPTPTPQPSASVAPTTAPTVAPTTVPTTVPTPSPVAGTVKLGFTGIGGSTDTCNSNTINVTKWQMGARNGKLVSMSAYVANTEAAPRNLYQMAIYSNVNGRPGNVIATTDTGILKANSWNTIAINGTLEAGKTYWLGYNTNGSNCNVNNMKYDNVLLGTKGGWTTNGTLFDSWPNPFGTFTGSRQKFSLYVSYLPQ